MAWPLHESMMVVAVMVEVVARPHLSVCGVLKNWNHDQNDVDNYNKSQRQSEHDKVSAYMLAYA
jgi:hypothetical protein